MEDSKCKEELKSKPEKCPMRFTDDKSPGLCCQEVCAWWLQTSGPDGKQIIGAGQCAVNGICSNLAPAAMLFKAMMLDQRSKIIKIPGVD